LIHLLSTTRAIKYLPRKSLILGFLYLDRTNISSH